MTAAFAIGVFAGVLISIIVVFAIKVSTDSIENIELRFNQEDAERLAFLDENYCDAVYNPGTYKWGIVTKGRKFVATGDTLHEAISAAQALLATAPVKL